MQRAAGPSRGSWPSLYDDVCSPTYSAVWGALEMAKDLVRQTEFRDLTESQGVMGTMRAADKKRPKLLRKSNGP
jgi:hypothetical protein